MSTCRVSSINRPPAVILPPAQERPAIEPALIFHTHYDWNSSGTRIRCAHKQCAEVFTVPEAGDVEAAETVFAEHQAKTLGALPVELAALRALKEALPGLVSDMAHGAPPLRIQAALFQLIAEADYAIGEAAELIIEAPRATRPAPVVEAAVEPEPVIEPAVEAEPAEAEVEPAPPAEQDPEAVEEIPEPEEGHQPEVPEIQELGETPAADVARIDVSGVAAGDRVRAVFTTEKHGAFEIEATVVAGIGLNQMVIGSWLISSAGTASAHLREVTVLAAAADNDQPVKPGSSAPEHFGTGV